MPIDRSTILRGPAIITYNGATFYSKGDITVELGLETFAVDTAAFGKVDERVTDRITKVRFTPDGQFEGLGVLWPYGSAAIGSSIFGATDVPLVIQTIADGKAITFNAAALTKMPDLELGATKTMLGEVEFTCLGTNNEAWTATSNLVSIAANAFADTSFSVAAILTQAYTGAWGGASPWSAITTSDGWKVGFSLGLTSVTTDADGMVDMTLESLEVTASCTPLGITEANLVAALKLQGSGATRGRSLASGSSDLVLTGTGAVITLKGAQLKTGPMQFGRGALRVGELNWIATKTFSSGAPLPLFSVATS